MRAQARRWEALLSPTEQAYLLERPRVATAEAGDPTPSPAEVIVDRRLPFFANPLAEVESALPGCRMLYVALAPDNEFPLANGHRAQFRAESFPPAIGAFTRIQLSVHEGEILAVYASPEYLRAYRQDASPSAELLRLRRQRNAVRASLLRLRLGAQRFEVSLSDTLRLHRSQRAWKVMLAVRKLYMMVSRQLFWGPVKFVFGQGPSRAEVEPPFPAPRDFMTIVDIDAPRTEGTIKPVYPAELAPARKYDVLVLPPFDFDRRPQRPQHLSLEYARQGHRVFWLSATRVLPLESPAAYHAVPLRDNLWEIHPRARHIEQHNAARQYHDAIQAMYREWATSEVVLLVQSPVWLDLVHELQTEPNTVVVFDCIDEGAVLDTWARTMEPALAREADLVLLSAGRQCGQFAGDTVLVPNGADFHLFRNAGASPQLAALRRPVIGYAGAIADSVDLDLVREVARLRPDFTFVLSGTMPPRDAELLKSVENIQLAGPRPVDERPGLLAGFDVCMLPLFPSRTADHTPMLECFAQGKPVVATGGVAELAYVATGAEDFARQLDRAVAESDSELCARRIACAQENTWQARVEEIHRAVAGNFEDPDEYVTVLPAGLEGRPEWVSRLRRHLIVDPSIGWITPVVAEESEAMRRAVQFRGVNSELTDETATYGIARREVWCAAGADGLADTARRLGLRACVAEDCVIERR